MFIQYAFAQYLCDTHGHILIARGAMFVRTLELQGCLVERAVSWVGLETHFNMWVMFHIVLSGFRI